MESIRAIYTGGQLRPLDPLNLSEGQEVRIQIVDERTRVLEVLSDVLVPLEQETSHESDFDEVALQNEIDDATQGVTLSDLIIEERQTGR